MEGYMGMVMLWAGKWPPRGWQFCEGQMLEVNRYQALYSIIGNSYGGNPNVNFSLPDMRGRVAVGAGQMKGSPDNRKVGQTGGVEQSHLAVSQLPSHVHSAEISSSTADLVLTNGAIIDGECEVNINLPDNATSTEGNTSHIPSHDRVLGVAKTGTGLNVNMYSTNPPNVKLNEKSIHAKGTIEGKVNANLSGKINGKLVVYPTGLGQPFSLMQPYAAVNYIICVEGLYPERDY